MHDRRRMVGELAALSRREDAAAKRQDHVVQPRPLAVPASAVSVGGGADFAELIESRMCGGVLTYSSRRALLALAPRYGIGRFEANLVIAAVQYRQDPNAAKCRTTGAAARPANVAPETTTSPSASLGRWTGYFGWTELLTALALQAALGLCMWHWIG